MRKGKDPDLFLKGRPKKTDQTPDPDPQHCYKPRRTKAIAVKTPNYYRFDSMRSVSAVGSSFGRAKYLGMVNIYLKR
jgi:hypothetical protein